MPILVKPVKLKWFMKRSRKKTNQLFVLIKNKVPLALRKVKDSNAPGKLENGVLKSMFYLK